RPKRRQTQLAVVFAVLQEGPNQARTPPLPTTPRPHDVREEPHGSLEGTRSGPVRGLAPVVSGEGDHPMKFRAALIPLHGGAAYEVLKDMIVVGRKSECDLCLDHKGVSKLH